jgi:hypothetical protein
MADQFPEATKIVLSQAAQAVLNAADSVFDEAGTTSQGIAAVLRAAVKQTQFRQYRNCFICDAAELLAIAAELDGTPITPLEENLER